MIDLNSHPCFSAEARHTTGRIHLPVAATCNIQCRFCDRKYDCVNESRPGVTSTLLSPKQAVYYLEKAMGFLDCKVAVAGIAGPGDAMAEPDITLETFTLVRERFPDILLCLATNGLNAADYVDQIAACGVSHVTVTVNAVDPEIGENVISWARFKSKVYRGRDAAALLLERQLLAIERLASKDILVKVNSIILPGINDHHIETIAKTVSCLGAATLNCIPLHPVEGTEFANLSHPDHEMMQTVRWNASQHIKVVRHCARCRSDAAGLLGSANSGEIERLLKSCGSMPLDPAENRPFAAVASIEGMLVNEHLGRARDFYIYKEVSGGFELVETRPAPVSGTGNDRWQELVALLHDCKFLVVNQVGETPKAILADAGLKVIATTGMIDDALSALYAGKEPTPAINGGRCSGSGGGCGG